ncbi:MAG: hypothetical protein LBD67_04130 [Candidatus Accumulibacter sp.]|nr:hypothetical protein [Accumulibacter sp.]
MNFPLTPNLPEHQQHLFPFVLSLSKYGRARQGPTKILFNQCSPTN